MAINNNVLEAVKTISYPGLAFLQNASPIISKANLKYRDFDKISANKGDTVSFYLNGRYMTSNGLVASWTPIEQEIVNVKVDQARNTSVPMTAEQLVLYGLEEYMNKAGKGAIKSLATQVEIDVSTVFETAPYRVYGDGINPITNDEQLLTILAYFRQFGAAPNDTCMFLDRMTYARLINSRLNQFAPDRNNKITNSWEAGSMDGCDFYKSDFLPIHTAGTEGEAGKTLTVVSTTTNSDGAITAITFSGTYSPSDANSVKKDDNFTFADVAGQPIVRFLTHDSYHPTDCAVQFRATADAASTAGSEVTVNIFPHLQVNPGIKNNITRPIVPGMQCTVLPSHRCAGIMSGNPLFLAMPKLPDQSPFATSTITDKGTGASLRVTHAVIPGQNIYGVINDVIWGKALASDYAMKIALPLK